MAKAEIDVQGWGDNGQMLVVCGNGLCFQNPPTPTIYKSIAPPPKLKEGQRAVYAVEYKGEPGWRIREPRGVSGGQAASISFVTFFFMYLASRALENWIRKKYFSDTE